MNTVVSTDHLLYSKLMFHCTWWWSILLKGLTSYPCKKSALVFTIQSQ